MAADGPPMPRRRVLQGGLGMAVLLAIGGLPSCSDGEAPDVGSGPGEGANEPVPRPAAMVRTAWANDPWTLGSYSFLPVGATPAHRAALAEPISGVLRFAGEATSAAHPSTVHGALASGAAAARAIIDEHGDDGPLDIVVVGAGAAGAAAARQLTTAGHRAIVLEARDRTGGRVHTVQPEGWPVPVELGASWVHDTGASDLADQLARLGVATVGFAYDATMLDARNEGAIDLARRAAPALAAIEQAVAWAEEQDDDLSILDALQASGAAGTADPAVLEVILRAEVAAEHGADPDELSAWWGTAEGSDGDDVLVTGGYQRLVDDLLDGVDVRLSHAVAAIVVQSDGVAVRTVGGEELRADQVVVTVPLGALRAEAIEFSPALPPAHLRAIGALGMGVLDKVWLRWDEPWWTDDHQIWVQEAPASEPYVVWVNLLPVTGEPILLALLGGQLTRTWAERSDDDVLRAAMRSLQRFADAGW